MNMYTVTVDWGIFIVMMKLSFDFAQLAGGGVVKRKLLDHVNILQSSLREEMERQGASSADKLLSCSIQLASSLPKYVRINEIAAPIAPSFEVIFAFLSFENRLGLVTMSLIQGGSRVVSCC